MVKIDIPEAVRLRAEAEGGAALAWLEALPDLAAGFERDWGIVVGATLAGGSAGYLAQVTTQAGEPAVLKLAMPGDDLTHEIGTLLYARGCGYARLLRHDADRAAMLLERLGPSLTQLAPPVDDQIVAICATLKDAWIPLAEPEGRMTGAEKARWLAGFIEETWAAMGRPCSRRAVDHALACIAAREAAYDPAACVLVHGDAHSDNTVQAPGAPSGFRFVDPDGLFAEPACDLAVPMREWSGELLAGDPLALGLARCQRLARLTGVDPRAIWEWGVAERMSTGLLATRVGYQPMGREMLAVSEAWAEA